VLVYEHVNDDRELSVDALRLSEVADLADELFRSFPSSVATFLNEETVEDAAVAIENGVDDRVAGLRENKDGQQEVEGM
jgi:hypothetical protein